MVIFAWCKVYRFSLPDTISAIGEFAPIEAEVDNKQGSQGEGDNANGGKGVTQVAPIAGPKVEHAA